MTKQPGTSLINWEEQLKKDSQLAVAAVQGIGLGNFIQTRNGKMTYGGAPLKDNKIDVVIVDEIAVNAYYEGKYDNENKQSPICYAYAHVQPDGTMPDMAPHEKAEQKQHGECGTCKWNAFKSDDRGRGKACKNIRRLALLAAADCESVESVRKARVAFLNVPVTSVAGYANFLRGLATVMKRPPYAVVANIHLEDDDNTQFRMLFEPVEKIDDKKVLQAIYDVRTKLQEGIMFPYPPNEAKAGAKAKGGAAKKSKFAR